MPTTQPSAISRSPLAVHGRSLCRAHIQASAAIEAPESPT